MKWPRLRRAQPVTARRATAKLSERRQFSRSRGRAPDSATIKTMDEAGKDSFFPSGFAADWFGFGTIGR